MHPTQPLLYSFRSSETSLYQAFSSVLRILIRSGPGVLVGRIRIQFFLDVGSVLEGRIRVNSIRIRHHALIYHDNISILSIKVESYQDKTRSDLDSGCFSMVQIRVFFMVGSGPGSGIFPTSRKIKQKCCQLRFWIHTFWAVIYNNLTKKKNMTKYAKS